MDTDFDPSLNNCEHLFQPKLYECNERNEIHYDSAGRLSVITIIKLNELSVRTYLPEPDYLFTVSLIMSVDSVPLPVIHVHLHHTT